MLSQLAEGERQKSVERPVINSFTVIKTLESLKGVRLLMSCDILEALCTQNCTVTVRYVYADSAKEVFTAGLGGRGKIKENNRKGEERGRWDAFIAPEWSERGGNNEISGLCEK